MLSDGLITISFVVHEHRSHLAALAERYHDRRPDLADLCLLRMSELYPQHSVVTVE